MQIINRINNSDKLKKANLRVAINVALKSKKQLLKWSSSKETKNNFGDALNPWLFKKITGHIPENANNILNLSNKPVYSCIGSILDNNQTKNLFVWGSGFKAENGTFKVAPKKILAVRGPLSRNNILKQGLSCPEVYGDPALLLPKFYNPEIKKIYKLGIIPHYVDKSNSNFLRLANKVNSDVLIINIEDEIETVINSILSCELIASSSLHGLIVADAYKIPSLFIKISDKIVGDDFKFRDYMESVGRVDTKGFNITNEVSINDIIDNFTKYNININLDKLLDSCPFK